MAIPKLTPKQIKLVYTAAKELRADPNWAGYGAWGAAERVAAILLEGGELRVDHFGSDRLGESDLLSVAEYGSGSHDLDTARLCLRMVREMRADGAKNADHS